MAVEENREFQTPRMTLTQRALIIADIAVFAVTPVAMLLWAFWLAHIAPETGHGSWLELPAARVWGTVLGCSLVNFVVLGFATALAFPPTSSDEEGIALFRWTLWIPHFAVGFIALLVMSGYRSNDLLAESLSVDHVSIAPHDYGADWDPPDDDSVAVKVCGRDAIGGDGHPALPAQPFLQAAAPGGVVTSLGRSRAPDFRYLIRLDQPSSAGKAACDDSEYLVDGYTLGQLYGDQFGTHRSPQENAKLRAEVAAVRK